MSAPTLVIVPGLWEGTAVFDPVREILTKNGFPVEYAPLRSTGKTSPNNPTLQDDIAGVRTVIEALVQRGTRVVVFAHSAGGFLGSAATEGLEVGQCQGPGGVEKFFFLAAGLFPAGSEHKSLPFLDYQGDKMFCKDSDKLLFNDVPADVKAKYEPLMTYQPGGNWGGVIPYAGWEKAPSMYLVTDKDQAIPPEKQVFMANYAKCKIAHVDLGHLAMLSGPEQVAEKLIDFVKS